MDFKTYLKIYAVPIGIVSIGFIFYFFVFDSLYQYQQKSIMLTLENQDKDNELSLEQIRMQEELDKIRKSANANFIQNTISDNLDRINSNINIEFNEKDNKQQEKEVSIPKNNDKKKHEKMEIDTKKDSEIKYTPYNPANTHIIPNNFSTNPNSPTNINLDSGLNSFDIHDFTLFLNTKIINWATPYSRHAKIYKSPSTNSKVIYMNKRMGKVQIIDVKKTWVKVRYAIKGKRHIEGYMPTNALKFKNM